MSEPNDAGTMPTGKEEIARLENLKEKLIHLEKVRARQVLVKTTGLVAIGLIIFVFCLNLYSSYKNFDKEKFSAGVEKEVQEQFQPRLDYLRQQSQQEIIPLIEKTIHVTVNEKLPEIIERLESIGEEAQRSMNDKLAHSIGLMLKKIEADLKLEINHETLELVLDNEEFEEMVAEEVYDQIRYSEGIVRDFRAEIEYLKNENPELVSMPIEKAEKVFLTSLLDLIKYDVDPELGRQSVAEKK